MSTEPSEVDLGAVPAGVAAPTVEWIITNGTLSVLERVTLGGDALPLFEVDDRCGARIEPGRRCVILLTYGVPNSGDQGARVNLSWEGGQATIVIRARGLPRLSIVTEGEGRVVSEPFGIDCPGSCDAAFDPDLPVRLHATPGAGWRISDWTGGWCNGPLPDCALPLVTNQELVEREFRVSFFRPVNNFIFVSSEVLPRTLGGTAPYDAACNRLATAAGINPAGGDGYIAAISDSSSLFLDRLRPGVRGWMRMDGKPFGDTVEDLLLGGLVYQMIAYDENLQPAAYGFSLSGTNPDGTLGDACSDWTSQQAAVRYTSGIQFRMGAGTWLGGGASRPCSDVEMHAVICMGNVQTAPLALTPTLGKRIWLTNTPYAIGSMTPDEKCNGERPAGVARAAALLPYTDRAAREVLDPRANYVRPDGQLVGTGRQLIEVSTDYALPTQTAYAELESAIWQMAAGTYFQDTPEGVPYAWTGASDLSRRGLPSETCNDWTDVNGTSQIGSLFDIDRQFWQGSTQPSSCSRALFLYCVEQ